jgi:hypothetical protein
MTALLTWVGAAGVVAHDRRLERVVLVSGGTLAVATGLTAALLLA